MQSGKKFCSCKYKTHERILGARRRWYIRQKISNIFLVLKTSNKWGPTFWHYSTWSDKERNSLNFTVNILQTILLTSLWLLKSPFIEMQIQMLKDFFDGLYFYINCLTLPRRIAAKLIQDMDQNFCKFTKFTKSKLF